MNDLPTSHPTARLHTRRGFTGLAGILAALLLSGCAAGIAYREGQSLVDKGKPREGIAKLEQANQLEPGSAEYRIGYLQARERYGQTLIERGDAARSRGLFDEAEASYREAVVLRTHQDRASAGLKSIERQRRWNPLLKAAGEAIDAKDWEGARTKLRLVLMEDPQQTDAVRLNQQVAFQVSQLEARKVVAPTVLSSAYRQAISLEFRDVPLRTVFDVVAKTSGLNFLFDKEVRTDQKTSIYLRNSTVEAAVSWLLLTNQLDQRVLDGNTVLIYPSNPAKQQEYKPLSVKSFYLANADAKKVAETLKTLLKSRDVVVDEKLNLVIMRDSPEAIRLAEKIVSLHDVREAEVMLEVEVLEVSHSRLLDLGVNWPTQIGLSVLPLTSGAALTLNDLRSPTYGNVGVSVGNLTINAQKQDGDTNLLANPRIRVRNHESAKIMIGDRVPSVTTTVAATGFASESVTYIDVGLKLDVQPVIYLDNEVAIKISLEVSNIASQQTTKNGSLIYQIGTRNAQTVLRLKDGENQVLAGLISDEDRRAANKVPGLGELPVVGRLFGEQSDNSTKSEIVLSITPHILQNLQRPELDALEFESGTESNLRSWPVIASGGAPPIAPTPGAAAAVNPNSVPVQATGASVAAGSVPTAALLPQPAGVAVASVAPAVPKSDPMPLLKWIGPEKVKAGETFTAQLMLQSDQPLLTAPLVLEFDPRALQIVSVTEGSFLNDRGAKTEFKSRIEPSGQVIIEATRVGTKEGASALGNLATFVMKVLPSAAANATQVQVARFAPMTTGGQSLAVSPPVPFSVSVTR